MIAGALLCVALASSGLAQEAGEDADGVEARSPRPEPRAESTPEQYAAQAKALRAAYSKPPAQWPKANVDEGVEFVELGLLTRKPGFPADNPHSKEKEELGRMLFYDPRLSGSGSIACASCHEAELGWSDGRAVSFGHERSSLARNSPTLNNVGYRKGFFWDGRAATLEEQALEPIAAAKEMNAKPEVTLARLAEQAEYRRRFKEVFGEERITLARVAQAIATFERTIVSRPSDFDRFLRGDAGALSDAAVRGLHLFRTDARCANCHMGPLLTDDKFHNLGLSYYGRTLQDLGRYEVTKDPKDVGKFRTPSLRNVTRSGPYMHNGLFDLDGVLRMYNAGMATLRRKPHQVNDPLFPTKSPLLRPLALNRRDLADLRAFLESLEELRLRVRPPELPGIDGGARGRSATTKASGKPAG
jgi:cytochrome c peroxidase